MKVAVVGGGIFGVTAAWMLAKDGHAVFLYEKEDDILQAASGINQYRLHRGFHYPRSKETILITRDGIKSFMREYGSSIVKDNIDHFYAIAEKGGRSSAKNCIAMWKQCSLPFKVADCDLINKKLIAQTVLVKEDLVDPNKLREACKTNLHKQNVSMLLHTEFVPENFKKYDYTVVATYANNNTLLEHIPHAKKLYQFELCEKPVLKLPKKFQGKSIVIIDGPFMCIDPMGSTGHHVMGNVVHAIHSKNIGHYPITPQGFKPLLNRGIIQNPPITNIRKFLTHAAEYMPGIENAEHIGSMYTFRTKPPYREHDDARPTTVDKIDGNIIVVFSGKIPTCVDAAEQVVEIIKS